MKQRPLPDMNAEILVDHLRRLGSKEKAAEMARYHKVGREYLGVANPVLNDIAKKSRQEMPISSRVELANALWASDLHEARILAAKMLTQARIRPDDDPAWTTIKDWVADFDAWAIADHACIAGQKRLVANPSRLDIVEQWTVSDHMWTRRAALVITLPWTKQNNPKPEELAARDRILGWAAGYVSDTDWFIQKAVAWWLRDLSKHDVPRVQVFLDQYGDRMKAFAKKEATRHLRHS